MVLLLGGRDRQSPYHFWRETLGGPSSLFSGLGSPCRRYTHYFYRVLKADYTFPAHRLNDVPICLYLMTHAYFMVRRPFGV